MCNRARNRSEPEAETWFGDGLLTERPRDNRPNPVELVPRGRAYVARDENGRRGVNIMSWHVLAGAAELVALHQPHPAALMTVRGPEFPTQKPAA